MILIIDIETGGLTPAVISDDQLTITTDCISQMGTIVEVAIILFDASQDKILLERSWVIKSSPVIIQEESWRVNQITLEEIFTQGVTIEEFADEFFYELTPYVIKDINEGWVESNRTKITIAGQRVDFDINFLRKSCTTLDKRWGEFFHSAVIDTKVIGTILKEAGHIEKSSLSDIATHLQYQGTECYHRAMADCKACHYIISDVCSVFDYKRNNND